MKSFLFCWFLVTALIGCGFKGPLYLPKEDVSQNNQVETVNAEDNNKNKTVASSVIKSNASIVTSNKIGAINASEPSVKRVN